MCTEFFTPEKTSYQASVSLNFACQRISYELSYANRTHKKCFTNVNFVGIVVRTSPICSQICDRVEVVADSANFAELTSVMAAMFNLCRFRQRNQDL